MATYKKRGYKNTNTSNNSNSAEADSATAEVFEKLDSTELLLFAVFAFLYPLFL